MIVVDVVDVAFIVRSNTNELSHPAALVNDAVRTPLFVYVTPFPGHVYEVQAFILLAELIDA